MNKKNAKNGSSELASSLDQCVQEHSPKLEDCGFHDYLYKSKMIVEESEDFISIKLNEVKKEMDKISNQMKESFFVALQQEDEQRTDYVRSKKFMLAFLRAEDYNPHRCALRLAKFFACKSKLFGPSKLPRRIRQDDLNMVERYILWSGYLHFAGVDCGDRLIFWIQWDRLHLLNLLQDCYIESIARVLFYQVLFSIEDNEQSQNKGVVLIHWAQPYTLPWSKYRILISAIKDIIWNLLPFQVVAVHHCCSYTNKSSPALFFQYMIPNHFKYKFDHHDECCLTKLSIFGINISFLPVTMTGEFKVKECQKELEVMKQKEANMSQYNSKSNELSQSEATQDEVEKTEEGLKTSCEMESDIDESPPQALTVSEDATYRTLAEGHLPARLMQILDSNVAPYAIWWSNCGTAFTIQKEEFSKQILPLHFKGIKFDSFMRRIKRWGFKWSSHRLSLGPNCIEYKHKLFLKNSPQLLEGWDNMNIKDKFPLRLMKILESTCAPDAIWWVNEGTSFAIENDKFESEVLEKHFQGVKLDSFFRSLRRWGFKQLQGQERTKNSAMMFYHACFQKDSPITTDLLEVWMDQLSSSKEEEDFLGKLQRILSSGEAKDAIWLLQSNDAIAIHRENFSRNILLTEFNGIKFRSFGRALSRWGFKLSNKVASASSISVFHPPEGFLNRFHGLDSEDK